MKVACERKCINLGTDGKCNLPEIIISGECGCKQFCKAPEFEPFREDNVVIFDNAGLPSIMVKYTRETVGNAELEPHPMFVIGNDIYDEIYVSKYPNTIINGRAYSLPFQKPTVNVTYDEAEKACFAKGEGWHLWTAAERGYIANRSLKNGTLPHGNTNRGEYHANPEERGECYDGYKTLTGTGPATWTDDHTVFGVHDLCGNVFEWCRGMRLMDGMLQVAKNNDAAMDIDLSKDSENWEPVLVNGKPVYIDICDGEITFTTDSELTTDYEGAEWGDVKFDFEPTKQMKELALFSGEPKAYLWADNSGERLPLCGGGWAYTSRAGVFYVFLSHPRSYSISNIGFRSAYYRKLNTDNCKLKGGC